MAGSEAVRAEFEEARARLRFAGMENPYVGPRPLELGEPLWGRDEEVAALYFLLSAERIVLLHSPSGAGKSSLVQAGLIQRLRESFDVWRPTRVNQEPGVAAPAGRPLNRYAHSAILGFEQGIPRALRRPAAELAGLTLAEYAAGRPARPGAPPDVVVIFDQFEEVLTVDPLAVAAKEEFFDQLGELLHDPRISALFLLREDYLAPLDPYADRVPTHLKNRFRIDLLGLAGAREAIVNPARERGREFPAADRLVHDLAKVKVQQPDGSFAEQTGTHVEPVQLQVVCRRLWDAMPEDDLSIDAEDLDRFGNVDSALADYYAETVARIAGGDLRCERAIRDWLGERLITAGGIRGQVLKGVWESEGLANGLVEQLRATHLVRAEKRAGAIWCELAHDRLIKPVREDNAAWRERHLSVVQRRAALWEREGRPAGLLLTAEDLADGEAWAGAHEAEITPGERRYLAASAEAAAAARQEALQARRIRKLAVSATVLAVAALLAGGFAGRLWLRAEEQARRTEDLARGGMAASLLETKPSQAGLVLLEVRGAEQDAPTVDALHRVLAVLEGKRDAKAYAALKHDGEVAFASFSPDGRRVVTASEDGTARLWNAETGRQERVLRNEDDGEVFHAASFSPDAEGWRVVTASSDGKAQIWDAATGRKLGGPLSHERAVRSASFSPDGRSVLTVSGEAARLWDATTGQKLGKPLSHERGLASASFGSPAGRRVVTASWDGVVRLWDVATGQSLGELRHREAVRSASFSPDGRLVVTASRDGAARLWDAETGRLSGEPLRHKDSLRSASFSPDGRSVLTASDDETARLWDLATGKEIAILEGHTAAVRFASFSPDGRRVVTASADGTARLWDLREDLLDGEALEVRETAKRFSNAAFSPDGSRIVTVSRTRGTSSLWFAGSGEESEPLSWEACGRVKAVSFTPDGRSLVAACEDGTVRIRDASSGAEAARLPGHAGVLAAVLSPDGSRLATASVDRPARIWDLRSKELIATFPGHARKVIALSFSPDGGRLATASADKTARIWSVATGKLLRTLEGHEAEVAAVSFSPDGARIVTASADVARLWDAGTGDLLAVLPGHEDEVTAVSFGPDGRSILTASLDRTLRRWANPSDYTLFLLGRLRARSKGCYNTEESCEDCLEVFSARLGETPEDRPESYVEAWRAYRECREGR